MGKAELSLLIKAKDEASNILGDISKAGLALGAAFVGFAAMAVGAAAREEVGMKQLQKAVENSGVAWDSLGGSVNRQVTAWQKLSGVADDEIRPAFALLIAQTGSLEEATMKMPIALDLARGGNIDLAMAAKLLGKLTDENVNVFKRMGLTFDKNATEMEVLAAVQAKFGGQSKEFAATAAGQMQSLQNEINDVVEEIGFALLPMLKEAIGWVRNFIRAFSEGGGLAGVKDAFLTVFGIIGEVFDVITGRAPGAGALLTKAIGPEPAKEIMNAVAGIREAFTEAFGWIKDNVIPPLQQAFKFLGDNWSSTAFAMKAIIWTVLVPAFSIWAFTAGAAAVATIIAFAPVILALAAVGVAAFLLNKVWTENLGGVRLKTFEVVGFIQDLFDGFKLFVLGIWRGILVGISNAVNGIIGVVNSFIDGYNALAEKLGLPLLGKIELITPNLTDVDNAINQVAADRQGRIWMQVSYIDPGPPSLGGMYAGGTDHITHGPELFMAGEAGPERVKVTPLARGTAGMDGGGAGDGTGVTVIIQGPVYGMDDFDQKVTSAVRNAVLRGGLRGVRA